MNIEFQYPEAFWLLLLIPLFIVLYVLYRLWKKKIVDRVGDKRLVESLIRSHSSQKEIFKFAIIILAFATGCIALANPRRPDKNSTEERSGIDVMIALDVSNSMMATDIAPNRLQNAQQLLQGMIAQMPNNRIGLVLFAGHAYLQMPLSTDHDAANLFISTSSPASVPVQGTAIHEALNEASAAFDKSDRFKTIVLITDGETHDEGAIETAKSIAKDGVMINTIGIGSTQGSTIIDTVSHNPKRDDAGNVVLSKLNEQLLQQLAGTTNGTYIHLQNPEVAVNSLLEQYKNVDKKSLPDLNSMNYMSFYWWLVAAMFLLLVSEIFLTERKRSAV